MVALGFKVGVVRDVNQSEQRLNVLVASWQLLFPLCNAAGSFVFLNESTLRRYLLNTNPFGGPNFGVSGLSTFSDGTAFRQNVRMPSEAQPDSSENMGGQ